MASGRSLAVLAICAAIASIAPAAGSDPGKISAIAGFSRTRDIASGWSVDFTNYNWLVFLNGSETVKGRTVGMNVDPFQVIDHLFHVPYFGYFEARKGAFAFYNDIAYSELALSGSGIKTFNGGATGTVGASVGSNFTQLVVEAGGIYEVARWEYGGSFKDPQAVSSFTAFDVLAGARYWYQNLNLNFDLGGTIDRGGLVISGNRAIARSGVVDWVDPLFGVRLRHQFEPGQEMLIRADVGGFGVGSELSWNALAAYNRQFFDLKGYAISGYIGYRALQVDYIQGAGRTRYEYDIIQHGPVTGLMVRF